MRQNYYKEITTSVDNIMLHTGKRLGLRLSDTICEVYDVDTNDLYVTATTPKRLRNNLAIEELLLLPIREDDELENNISALDEFEDL